MAKEYDPRMHSAEHILNQTMVRMYHRGRSFSAHIEKKKSKCDYHFDRDLTPQEVASLEQQVNDVIKRNLPVRVDFLPRDEAAKEFELNRLPDTAGDTIRIIRIGDYDACPCRGEHVASTAAIGKFKILSTDFAGNVLRIRFRLDEQLANGKQGFDKE